MSEIRELLKKWAELEPSLCEKLRGDGLTVWTQSGAAKQVWNPDDFTALDLAWIQWATQQAITVKGWGYSLEYSRSTKLHYAAVFTGEARGEVTNNSNGSVVTLLAAYLQALEVTR